MDARTCPACGGPNRCRVAGGEGYKGRCWCEEIVVSPQARDRVLGDLPEAHCLCEHCLRQLAAEEIPRPLP